MLFQVLMEILMGKERVDVQFKTITVDQSLEQIKRMKTQMYSNISSTQI